MRRCNMCMLNDGISEVAYGEGYYSFKLKNLLDKKALTRYRLSHDIKRNFMIVDRYATGDTTRLDLNILSMICDDCNCQLKDVVEYVPNHR